MFNNNLLNQLPRVALMGWFVWLMDLWRVLAEWRSASMECGEQCVIETGITMMPELCADNWGTVSTQVQVSWFGKSDLATVIYSVNFLRHCQRFVYCLKAWSKLVLHGRRLSSLCSEVASGCSGDQLRVFVKMPSEKLGKVNVKPDIPNLYSMRNIHSFVSMPNCRSSPFSGDIFWTIALAVSRALFGQGTGPAMLPLDKGPKCYGYTSLYNIGIAAHNAPFGQGTGPVFLYNVNCTGTEYYLLSCRRRIDYCSHYYDAGVICPPCKLQFSLLSWHVMHNNMSKL